MSASSSSLSYETRLRDIETLEKELEHQLKFLEEYPYQHHGGGSWKEQQDLLRLVKEHMYELERRIEEWERVFQEECENEIEKQHVSSLIKRHHKLASHYHVEMRKLILQCKRRSEHHHLNERQELLRLSGDSEYVSRHSGGFDDASSREITEALERTTQLMSNEVEKSQHLVKTLTESSHTNVKIRDEYLGFSTILRDTKSLVNHLKQRETMDRILVLMGLLVYLLIIAYIVRKRIFSSDRKIPAMETDRPNYSMDIIAL